jgi:ATP synthase protein I
VGNRVLAELIGGLAGGAFFGWVIDQFAGTRPWGLLVMLFVGIGVAFRNIIRISNGRS